MELVCNEEETKDGVSNKMGLIWTSRHFWGLQTQFEIHVVGGLMYVYAYYGHDHIQKCNALTNHDIVLTTYGVLASKWSQHASHLWHSYCPTFYYPYAWSTKEILIFTFLHVVSKLLTCKYICIFCLCVSEHDCYMHGGIIFHVELALMCVAKFFGRKATAFYTLV